MVSPFLSGSQDGSVLVWEYNSPPLQLELPGCEACLKGSSRQKLGNFAQRIQENFSNCAHQACIGARLGKMAMDVVWKLGIGGGADNWELRMSMRSFERNYAADANYWIIGYIPGWVDRTKVQCLPWPDPYQKCKDANLIQKALRLAMDPDVSDPFVFCSDDYFVLRPIQAHGFKLWHCGEIPEELPEGATKWLRRLHETGSRLRAAGYPALNFDVHVPLPMRKAWIRETLRFDFGARPGMCVYSTIINCSRDPGTLIERNRVRGWLCEADIPDGVVDRRLTKSQFACLTDRSLGHKYLVSKIEELFPDPAPWELDAATWRPLSQSRESASVEDSKNPR